MYILKQFRIYQKIGALTLMAALFLQSFQRALIIGAYYFDTASYAAHCENKDKPAMHCNGKCQMIKKLKQADHQEKQVPASKASSRELVLFIEQTIRIDLHTIGYLKQTYPELPVPKTMDYPHSLFRPPVA